MSRTRGGKAMLSVSKNYTTVAVWYADVRSSEGKKVDRLWEVTKKPSLIRFYYVDLLIG